MYIRGRNTWGARTPRAAHTKDDWSRSGGVTAVIHHTAGAMPRTLDAVKRELKGIQYQHQVTNGWSDIGYNYLIDRLGRVWEGRGWENRGAHTLNCNTNTIGISFMGNYDLTKLNTLQRVAYFRLVRKLQKKGANITRIKGHREMPGQATACPGRHPLRQLRGVNKRLLRAGR